MTKIFAGILLTLALAGCVVAPEGGYYGRGYGYNRVEVHAGPGSYRHWEH